jgi:hypothetical protein
VRKNLNIRNVAIALLCVVAWVAIYCPAQSPHQPTAREQHNLEAFLIAYEHDPSAPAEPLQYKSAFVDLNDDGTFEVAVYFTDFASCGSGGCELMILTPTKSSYKVVARTTVTRPPIRVLNSKTHGWHDITVRVSGGGIMPGYEAKLEFNGRSYPSNPTVPPARQAKGKVVGRVLIADGQ